MFARARATGPVILVPAAWLVVGGAHLEVVSTHALFVAHVVMATVIALFAILSWREMGEGALLAWRWVLVVGIPVTLSGVVGLQGVEPEILLGLSLYGWMILPAVGLLYTGRVATAPYGPAYLAGGVLSLLGAALYAGVAISGGPVAGLVAIGALGAVGIGQTVGIATAVVHN